MLEANRINIIIKLIELYGNQALSQTNTILPLSAFLSNYYRANKQMGSKDRKTISGYIYAYYRLGKALINLKPNQRLSAAGFLFFNEELAELKILNKTSEINYPAFDLKLEEKINFIEGCFPEFKLSDLFPFQHDISSGIDSEKHLKSFLCQPKLWIRIKKGKNKEVINELNSSNITFQVSEEIPNALSIENKTKLDDLITRKKGYFEIQDISSQKTRFYFKASEYEKWWDCCAGAGGKTLLLSEESDNIHITATDTRETILKNLKSRLEKSGVKNFNTFPVDILNNPFFKYSRNYFDGIIADVPCSGSGTWARTPEMVSFFQEKKIQEYSKQQIKILRNILPYLKQGKPLIYITCSVFKAENEDVIFAIAKEFDLEIESYKMIIGQKQNADNLFVARLVKKQ